MHRPLFIVKIRGISLIRQSVGTGYADGFCGAGEQSLDNKSRNILSELQQLAGYSRPDARGWHSGERSLSGIRRVAFRDRYGCCPRWSERCGRLKARRMIRHRGAYFPFAANGPHVEADGPFGGDFRVWRSVSRTWSCIGRIRFVFRFRIRSSPERFSGGVHAQVGHTLRPGLSASILRSRPIPNLIVL